MKNRFVIYMRVSTRGQGDSGLGLEAQQRDINLFIESYAEAYEVMGEFTDIESGSRNDRKGLNQALALCRQHSATLLVAKLDRLSRRVSYIAALIEEVDLRVACMPHADTFQLHIYAALAEQERAFISVRTKAALAEAKRRGVVLGGLRDQTQARNAAKRAQADAEAERYRNLLTPMVEAGMTLQAMADALTDAVQGTAFYPKKISRMVNRLGLPKAH